MLMLSDRSFSEGNSPVYTGYYSIPLLYVPNEQQEVQLNEFFTTAISLLFSSLFLVEGVGGGGGVRGVISNIYEH